MYTGVPQNFYEPIFKSEKFLAKPKSINLIFIFESNKIL